MYNIDDWATGMCCVVLCCVVLCCWMTNVGLIDRLIEELHQSIDRSVHPTTQ
jgi:hypothetical protein